MQSDAQAVFISYAHGDREWKERIVTLLRRLDRNGRVVVWDDSQIPANDDRWYGIVHEVMQRSSVAVCLLSPCFASSSFCMDEEVPTLLNARRRGKTRILALRLTGDIPEDARWLRGVPLLPEEGPGIADLPLGGLETVMDQATGIVEEWLSQDNPPTALDMSGGLPPGRAEVSSLPNAVPHFFGREQEIREMDAAWVSPSTRVLVVRGAAGSGKSSLVRYWCEDMAECAWRGASRVFAWRFQGPGSGEGSIGSELFLDEALRWVGDESAGHGSPWQRGERLAAALRQERSLLVLDGVEALQAPDEPDRGRLRDIGVRTLLEELEQPPGDGLCVLTTREPLPDLTYEGVPLPGVKLLEVENLSVPAGRALLHSRWVDGSNAELESVVERLGGHSLALELAGAWLARTEDRHIRHISHIVAQANVTPSDAVGFLVDAILNRIGHDPTADLLRVLALFDQPASIDEILAVCRPPAITGLTEHLADLDGFRLAATTVALSEDRLAALFGRGLTSTVDVHSLVRQHARDLLLRVRTGAWTEGHRRIYEYLRTSGPESPTTMEGMVPLQRAVVHGCRAGLHQRALDEVYYPRIQQREKSWRTHQLGEISSELAVVASFFERRWDLPSSGLSDAAKAYILNEAGFDLRALGRIAEAGIPLRLSRDIELDRGNTGNAAQRCGNLAKTLLALGKIDESIEEARRSVVLADQSGWATERMKRRADLACCVFAAGRLDEAEALAGEAMRLAATSDNSDHYCFLDELRCQLPLERGRPGEALSRASCLLQELSPSGAPMHVGLIWLVAGRAALASLPIGCCPLRQTIEGIERGFDLIKQSGRLDLLPPAYCVRATLRRHQGDLNAAGRDLVRSARLAEDSGMRLAMIDAMIEGVRILKARGDTANARAGLDLARAEVTTTGYGLRQHELDTILKALD